ERPYSNAFVAAAMTASKGNSLNASIIVAMRFRRSPRSGTSRNCLICLGNAFRYVAYSRGPGTPSKDSKFRCPVDVLGFSHVVAGARVERSPNVLVPDLNPIPKRLHKHAAPRVPRWDVRAGGGHLTFPVRVSPRM